MGFITHSANQLFSFSWEGGNKFTQEYKPVRQAHTQIHTPRILTSQNGKTMKQHSEEQAQRNGSRIVLCSTIGAGPCFCCFIKGGVGSG